MLELTRQVGPSECRHLAEVLATVHATQEWRGMHVSRWWKCDLQSATPWAEGALLPAGTSWDLTSDDAAAAAYGKATIEAASNTVGVREGGYLNTSTEQAGTWRE